MNEEGTDCFDKAYFGQSCTHHNECLDDCSLKGNVINVCLLSAGSNCAQSSECANNLNCLSGNCSCNV